MYNETCKTEDVRSTIRYSCVPLLCGSGKAVRQTARLLRRLYGVSSYALLVDGLRLPLPPGLRYIRTHCRTPRLLADISVRFFESLDPSAVPVLIDCTDDRSLLTDPSIRLFLESHCFLSDPIGHTRVPPFCYLSDGGERIDPEGGDGSC